ncbi:hypothetical protein ACERCG_05800 [Mannheimia sp. E30BD]|uniref:hypothetical protein n=1 Tax=Mannheimia sp. E30BD TaxID=3278708 RepID=UPI00359E40FB
MSEIKQNVENSHIANMAGRDIHITHIHQNTVSVPRNKMIAEILQCRQRSSHFEYLINTHAAKCYSTRYFKEMPDTELQEMYEFVCHLKSIFADSQRPRFVSWVFSLFKFKRKR